MRDKWKKESKAVIVQHPSSASPAGWGTIITEVVSPTGRRFPGDTKLVDIIDYLNELEAFREPEVKS